MNRDITALYASLDDFCNIYQESVKERLLPDSKLRKRWVKISNGCMIYHHGNTGKHTICLRPGRGCFVWESSEDGGVTGAGKEGGDAKNGVGMESLTSSALIAASIFFVSQQSVVI